MALITGTSLGPYEVLSPLGVGGRGEVYRERDRRLNREVAIKVLPEAFLTDPERLARFQREAQVLASLNHPNIAAIYGVEEGVAGKGAPGRFHALVMDLLTGRRSRTHRLRRVSRRTVSNDSVKHPRRASGADRSVYNWFEELEKEVPGIEGENGRTDNEE